MIVRIIKAIIVLCVLAFALYLVQQNSAPLTLTLAPGYQYTGASGIFLIATFVAGLIFMSVIAGYFSLKARFRQRRLEKMERQRQTFFEDMVRARGLLAAGDWEQAQIAWERIIKGDPSSIIARVELSRCYEGKKELKAAMKVLDDARSADPTNLEALFRAAELNMAMGNKTVAIDNLALVLYHHPSVKAARLARDLSSELGRAEDALEYHSRLESLVGVTAETKRERRELEFQLLVDSFNQEPHIPVEDRKKQLLKFLKAHGDHAPTLALLAALERELGNYTKSAERLVEAGRVSGDTEFWTQAAKIWIDHDMAGNALSAAKTAVKNTSGEARLEAEIHLIRLQIALNMLEDAETKIDSFEDIAREADTLLSPNIICELLILRGLTLNRMGRYRDAGTVWRKLSKKDYTLQKEEKALPGGTVSSFPAPELRYSTP